MSTVTLREKSLLPKSEWRFWRPSSTAGYVVAGIYEYPPGCIFHVKIPIADLPNEQITLDDLARFGITIKKF